MPAPTRTPRKQLDRRRPGRSLAVGGSDAVRIDSLAQRLGVTRGGFYWHFERPPARCSDEMLDTWSTGGARFEVLERVEARGRRRTAGQGPSPAGGQRTPATSCCRSTLPCATGRGATRASPNASAASTTAGWTSCWSLIGVSHADAAEIEARSLLAFSLAIGNHFIAARSSPRLEAAMRHLER